MNRRIDLAERGPARVLLGMIDESRPSAIVAVERDITSLSDRVSLCRSGTTRTKVFHRDADGPTVDPGHDRQASGGSH
jgi:hypothetical protein